MSEIQLWEIYEDFWVLKVILVVLEKEEYIGKTGYYEFLTTVQTDIPFLCNFDMSMALKF